MSIVNPLFNKDLNDIQIGDIQTFFSVEQEESSILEFKSGEVSLEAIYKEICAFLNTEGGVLIIGAPKEKKVSVSKNSSKIICKGDLTPSKIRGKDWLMQKIASNIVPSPTGIGIQEILTNEGNYFVVHIPQSLNPPHQCSHDGVYYIRLEREAKAAPHGLIQALFNSRREPSLRVTIGIFNEHISDKKKNLIECVLDNISNYPAENITIYISFYNVKKVTLKYAKDIDESDELQYLDNRFIYEKTTTQVLVKGIYMRSEFEVDHNMEPYIILTHYWARNSNLVEKTLLFDPISAKIIDSYNSWDTTELDFDTLYEKLLKLKVDNIKSKA